MFGGIIVGFLEILESYVVIDNKSVRKIRERIFLDNPLITSEEKSRRLIEKIHTIINEELTGIDLAYTKVIRTNVLKRSVKDNGILVTYADIVNCIAELNLSLEEMVESIKAWYDHHMRGSEITLIQLIDYIKSIQSFDEPEQAQIETIAKKQVDEHVEEVLEPSTLFSIAYIQQNWKTVMLSVGILFLLVAFFMNGFYAPTSQEKPVQERQYQTLSFMNAQELFHLKTVEHGYFNEIIHLNSTLETPGIPSYLYYHAVDKASLQNYLRSRNSILAEAPYFEGILKVSEEYDIHPLLMFAITGQEQGYVNKDNPNHLKIANNPFNVYTSWRKYNTDIEDSTSIAAGTVVTILRNRPERENPFKWINQRYAEDKNWARGVEMIFNFLMQYQL